ncbi:Holliday junction branch migration protein RuvA [Candidatus Dependentiae bacterium]
MIERLTGEIIEVADKHVVISSGGVGFLVIMPKPQEIAVDSQATIFCHLHWNQDRGPSLFGFKDQLERSLFLMLINCHKIGPQIALQILSQTDVRTFVEIISTGQENELSKFSGIGPKKARQLVSELQEKVYGLMEELGENDGEASFTGAVHLKDVSEALKSLGYSTQEALQAVKFATKNGAQSFEQVMRSSLSYLSKVR